MLRPLLISKILPIFTYGIVATYPRNKSDRISLERLNRYVARLATNNYTSSYNHLLEITGMLPVYRTVVHRRILLAQRYSRGIRYLPSQTIIPFFPNPYQRRRFHDFAIVPSVATGLRYRDSALEQLTQAWNRLPTDLVNRNTTNIKQKNGVHTV